MSVASSNCYDYELNFFFTFNELKKLKAKVFEINKQE